MSAGCPFKGERHASFICLTSAPAGADDVEKTLGGHTHAEAIIPSTLAVVNDYFAEGTIFDAIWSGGRSLATKCNQWIDVRASPRGYVTCKSGNAKHEQRRERERERIIRRHVVK